MMRNFWIQSLQESCKGNRIQRAIVDDLIATLSHNALNPMVFRFVFFLVYPQRQYAHRHWHYLYFLRINMQLFN